MVTGAMPPSQLLKKFAAYPSRDVAAKTRWGRSTAYKIIRNTTQ
jgi:hypothetical protein